MGEGIICIYELKNIKNKKVYVGSTSDFVMRKRKHLEKFRRDDHDNRHLQFSYNKYGEDNFKFSILEECSEEDLITREQHYYDLYVKKIGKNNIYNIGTFVDAPMRGRKHTDETKLKMSKSRKGRVISEETKKKLSIKAKGRKLSKETKLKISKSMSGKNHHMYGKQRSDETKKKISESNKGKHSSRVRGVYQININNGEIIQSFNSLTEASKETGSGISSISECCSGKNKSSGGYFWKYIDQ